MLKEKALKPTESELEILSVLWDLKKASVRMVHEKLSEHKDSGYTTTLKLMQIMHEKKLVTRDDSSKSHIYEPAVSKENTQHQFLHRMIDNLFSGSSTELVLQALGHQNTTQEELLKIEALIKTLKSKQKA
jgi:BlaI family transcriptional regulator, penicillinase repressor